MLDTNVRGLIAMTKAIVPSMVRRNRGHVINMSSIAGHEAYSGGSVYCASKHAVDAYSNALRHDLVATQVRASTVACTIVLRLAVLHWRRASGCSGASPIHLRRERAELLSSAVSTALLHGESSRYARSAGPRHLDQSRRRENRVQRRALRRRHLQGRRSLRRL